jgi:hypothetical protein
VSDCMRLSYSPANAEAAQLYRENMKEYVRRVKVGCRVGMVVELCLFNQCLSLFRPRSKRHGWIPKT